MLHGVTIDRIALFPNDIHPFRALIELAQDGRYRFSAN